MATCHNLPLMLTRDFNEILQVEDKLEGASPCILKGFEKWFNDNVMMDLGYSGPKFTST